MSGHEDDEARIARLLSAGRLSADEAERLREILAAQAERDGTWQRHAARRRRGWRRRTVALLAALLGAVAAGICAGWLLFADTAAPDASRQAATRPVEPAAARADKRPVDLAALAGERRTTMNRSLTLSVALILLAVLVVLGGGFMLLYNGLVEGRERVNAGWAQVENVYQRRLDLLPLLIDSVMTYVEHERETLAELTAARARAVAVSGMLAGEAPDTVEQLKAIEASQGAVESALARLFAVVESYPDLKASDNFRVLQDQIEGTENRIAVERRNFNEFARRYNAGIQKFPGNVVADLIGFEAKPYFEADTEALQGLRDPFARGAGG